MDDGEDSLFRKCAPRQLPISDPHQLINHDAIEASPSILNNSFRWTNDLDFVEQRLWKTNMKLIHDIADMEEKSCSFTDKICWDHFEVCTRVGSFSVFSVPCGLASATWHCNPIFCE